MNYEIREIRPGEAATLKRLACPNFSMVEQLFMSRPKMGIVAQAEDQSVAGGAFLVIVAAGAKKVGCIDIIFVLPQYRGSGVAKQLYQSSVEKLHQQGCDTVMALVRGDNSQSLRRFEAEGLHPISLQGLRQKIGLAATAALFVKTASLACATRCWILCEEAVLQSIDGNAQNIARTFLTNGVLLLCGALFGSLLHTESTPWWNLLAALFFLTVITLGESLGRKAAGGSWRFVLPEGGLVPTAIIALLGGFYPMLGHWYLTERENTEAYRKRMAAPAIAAWLALMAATLVCGILNKMHPFFGCGVDLGVMLLVFYMLPFYPFDTFGGRRVREYNERSYGALVTFSIITLALMVCGILFSIACLLAWNGDMEMKTRFSRLIAVFLLCLCCTLAGCSSGEILSQTNNDDMLSMETQDYTDTLERTITIKTTQSGFFSTKIRPKDGKIKITITDGNGEIILSMNQDASLSDPPAVTKVINGNGTYRLTVKLQQYSGFFNVSWTVDESKGKDY